MWRRAGIASRARAQPSHGSSGASASATPSPVEPLQPARGDRRHAVDLQRPREIDPVRAQQLREIVGGTTDLLFRLWQAERRPHRPVEPGAGICRLGPGGLVERAEDQDVGLLQAGLERAPDRQPRMHRDPRLHALADDQAAVEIGIVGASDRERWQRGVEQAGEERAGGGARLTLPEGGRHPRVRQARQSFGNRDVRGGELSQRMPARLREQLGQWLGSFRQPLDQGVRVREVLGPQPLRCARAPLAGEPVGLRPRQRRAHAGEAAAEIGRAECGDLERAGRFAHVECREPEPRQRMLQQRHQRRRREPGADRLEHELEEGARHCFCERTASGIVDPNAPRSEPRGNPARQQPVGRDERGRHIRLVSGAAQDQRNCFRLVVGGRGGDAADSRECRADGIRIGMIDETAPGLGGRSRPHGLADHPRACGRRRARLGARQRGDLTATDAERLEQGGEAPLRVLGMLGQYRPPGRIVDRLVEARQDDRTLGERADCADQLSRRRDGASHAGNDHRSLWRRDREAPRLGHDHAVAPVGRREHAAFGKMRRPHRQHDLEEGQRFLPVIREGLGHQVRQAVEAHVLGLDHVHQRRELAGQRGRLRRRPGACRDHGRSIVVAAAHGCRPAHHQPGHLQAALQLADCGRHVGDIAAQRIDARETAEQRRGLVDLRDRTDARQQHRPAATAAQERLLKRARRAPGRQQDRHVRQVDRTRRMSAGAWEIASEDRGGEAIEEWPPDRHRGHGFRSHSRRGHRALVLVSHAPLRRWRARPRR